ncbi:MAG: DedA family protein [Candidatus Roizmanbacteria bacterium]|nr:MAG: DedA family protein [Candidatus Roizmanbacteria bacterium]
MEQIIAFLTNLIIQVIEKSGYAGIFILMAAESALIPIPSEVTMTFAGYLASIGKFNIYMVIFMGAFANLVGSIVAYWLGYWGEDAFIRDVIKKYGKWVFITVDEYEKSERWFRKYGEKIVFITRVLPIIRTFISLPAGVAKMNFWRFSVYTFVGSLIWSALLTYIGFVLGKNWHSLEQYYRKFEYAIVAGIVILVIYYIHHKWKKITKKLHP